MYKSSPTISIFTNFNIDNEERFIRMKDSLSSFIGLEPDQWVINVRGKYKELVAEHLRSAIRSSINLTFLESKQGWHKDSRVISKDITSDIVFYWLEDHLCLVEPNLLRETINEMFNQKVDILPYSFYEQSSQDYSPLKTNYKGKFLKTFLFNKESRTLLKRKYGKEFYSVNLVCCFKREFFIRMINCNRPLLKRWPKKTPFDFEKKFQDINHIDFCSALPNTELFAAIDDDHFLPNYSLISRGKYPDRMSREKVMEIEYPKTYAGRIKAERSIQSLQFKFFNKIKTFLRRVLYTLNY